LKVAKSGRAVVGLKPVAKRAVAPVAAGTVGLKPAAKGDVTSEVPASSVFGRGASSVHPKGAPRVLRAQEEAKTKGSGSSSAVRRSSATGSAASSRHSSAASSRHSSAASAASQRRSAAPSPPPPGAGRQSGRASRSGTPCASRVNE
jgi:hypothetical protein